MSKVKYTQTSLDIASAIENGYGELRELRDEMTSWRDNLEERLSHTEKYERVSEVADALDSVADNEHDVPDGLDSITALVNQGRKSSKKSPYPRWLRLENACNSIIAAAEALDNFAGELDDSLEQLNAAIETPDLEELKEDYNSSWATLEEALEGMSQKITDTQQLKDDVETLRDELNNDLDEVSGIEFPGMYG